MVRHGLLFQETGEGRSSLMSKEVCEQSADDSHQVPSPSNQLTPTKKREVVIDTGEKLCKHCKSCARCQDYWKILLITECIIIAKSQQASQGSFLCGDYDCEENFRFKELQNSNKKHINKSKISFSRINDISCDLSHRTIYKFYQNGI